MADREEDSCRLLFVYIVCLTCCRLLFSSLDWFKSLPSLSRLLHHDQLLLVGHTWCPIFILAAAESSLPIQTGTVVAPLYLYVIMS